MNMTDTEVEDIRTSKIGDQRSITKVGEWEIEEAEPLQTRQQEVVRNKERETSVWVLQNLIKLGKVLGADFQGYVEETLELLLQVDSARQARRMEPETMCKKTRLRGSQELKSLVNFDVKLKNSGNRRSSSDPRQPNEVRDSIVLKVLKGTSWFMPSKITEAIRSWEEAGMQSKSIVPASIWWVI
ncbi:hypothetical protein H5410_041727 [Solanum commersonii]|uniref:Uncharacterized protein n=1 Tax=Solanum commersonii TaxID=4109 RepID=A0A9J5XTP4_SOLCO|nr:hypothetical protein H5410_041727 [Solanum commersonii]